MTATACARRRGRSIGREPLKSLNDRTLKEADLFARPQRIRNEVIHIRREAAITVAEVVEYKEFVDSFLQRLKTIKNPLRNFPAYEPGSGAP
jgi:hypothetical protein